MPGARSVTSGLDGLVADDGTGMLGITDRDAVHDIPRESGIVEDPPPIDAGRGGQFEDRDRDLPRPQGEIVLEGYHPIGVARLPDTADGFALGPRRGRDRLGQFDVQ